MQHAGPARGPEHPGASTASHARRTARCGGALQTPTLPRPSAAAGPIARPAPARQEPPARLLGVRAAAAEPPTAAAARRAATPMPGAAAAATSGVGVVGAGAAPEPPPQLEEVVVVGNT